MKQLLLLTMIVLWGGLCFAEDTGTVPYTITSSKREIVVTAPELNLASSIAGHTQQLKDRMVKLFDYRVFWKDPMLIELNLYLKKVGDEEVELWSVSLRRPGERKEFADLYRHRTMEPIVETLAYFIVRDIVFQGVPVTSPQRKIKTPLWVYVGAREYLFPRNRQIFQKYIIAKIKSDEVFFLGDLMELVGRFPDAKRNELVNKQSGSLFGFLMKQKKGSTRLREALQASSGGDLTESVLQNFGFQTTAELDETWRKFVEEKSEKTIPIEKLTLMETKKRLDAILRVEIEVIDRKTSEKQKIVTDFAGLTRHKKQENIKQIAYEKYTQILRLRLKSKDEYQPILGKYQAVLQAVIKGRWRKARRFFKQAEKMRKKLESTSPYLTNISGWQRWLLSFGIWVGRSFTTRFPPVSRLSYASSAMGRRMRSIRHRWMLLFGLRVGQCFTTRFPPVSRHSTGKGCEASDKKV